jgi:alkylation response protein AidB-like acyl-CoA dehydrogenase
MTTIASPTAILSDELLARFASRAPTYDRDNRFFSEDFADLKAAGYLTIAVPQEFGGAGLSLAEVCLQQRRLAYYAPATAIATNMHLYWTGVAADLRRLGDSSLTWLLEEAAAGEVFAAGHSESGNDFPVLWSTAKAERVDGGYRFFGRKNFCSLTPVWTRLGLHALDTADPANPRVVHAFLPRDTPGYHIEHTWDTLGMRASQSDDTVLEGAFIPDRYVAAVVPPDFAGANLFVLCIFAWAMPTFGNVYLGLAQRARALALAAVQKKTSIALGGKVMAQHPMIQYAVAELQLELEAATPQIERVAAEWSAGVDHGHDWPAKLVGAKYRAVESAKRVVDLALEVTGGAGIFRSNELERLYRDVRLGTIHPANSALVHEIVGKAALGLLGQQPRW